MAEVKLRCGVYGEGSVFSVDITLDADVEALQEKIAGILSSEQHTVAPRLLTLYLARKTEWGGGIKWLKDDDNLDALLRGDVEKRFTKMRSSWKLTKAELLGPAFAPEEEDIHVLVELPEAAVGVGVLERSRKRKFSEERLVKLKDLWRYSKMNIAALPKPKELKAILQ